MKKTLLFLCACFMAISVAAQPVQRAEYNAAKTIMMHCPGEEMFLGVVHPAAALFEEYLDLDVAAAEHAEYQRQLRQEGIRVVTVRDILLQSPIYELRKLAAKHLIYDASSLPSDEQVRQEVGHEELLRQATPQDLVRIIMLQPTVTLRETPTNTGLAATYSEAPMMNLFFMRDQMITTAKGVVVGRLNSPQRAMENDIADFCLRQLGIEPLGRIDGEGEFLEGGDFLPAGGKAFIGCGMRTTQAAIDRLMREDWLGCDSLVVVKDVAWDQAQMHLDTYFNIIDRDLATLIETRLDARPGDKTYLTYDLWVRGDNGYAKAQTGGDFVTFLREDCGMEILKISRQDGDSYANNFLTLSPRRIAAIAGQSEAFARDLARHDVEVIWIAAPNLIRGYGAAHCMTQVLERE